MFEEPQILVTIKNLTFSTHSKCLRQINIFFEQIVHHV
jgi:hypothetical protein